MNSNIFLCVKDLNLIRDMIQISNMNKNVKLVGMSTTIIECVESLVYSHADILVIEPEIDEEKACEIIKRIRLHENLINLKIITLFEELDGKLIHRYLNAEINNFLIEPITADDLYHAIMLECKSKKDPCVVEDDVDLLINSYLLNLGVPNNLKGFSYLKTAITLMNQYHSLHNVRITKIYADVARCHCTTQSRVEKCIRTAIASAYEHQPALISINSSNLKKPTNSQLMIHVSEKIRIQQIVK